MITYEEFIKENEIDNLASLEMGSNNVRDYMKHYKGAIQENPVEYLDVARNARNLKNVSIFPIQMQKYTKELREFIQECNDEISISCADRGEVSKEEFFIAENMIDSIIEQIQSSWTVKEKLAFVHYKMGELITYYPEYNYNNKNIRLKSADIDNNRNIWKMLNSGLGVCNGITKLQQTILARVGVETQELSSKTHSYMLTKLEDGSNVITDATWDLGYTLFGTKPQHFGLSYETFIKKDGVFSRAHQLENPPENVVEISDTEIRDLYQNIGILNEDRVFDSGIVKAIKSLNYENGDTEFDKAKKFFDYIKENESEKFSHMEECAMMLGWAIRVLGIKSENCITQYVYSKDDKYSENPNLVFCVKGEKEESIVEIINNKTHEMEEISLEELENKYNCHMYFNQEPFWKKMLEKDNEVSEIQKSDIEK